MVVHIGQPWQSYHDSIFFSKMHSGVEVICPGCTVRIIHCLYINHSMAHYVQIVYCFWPKATSKVVVPFILNTPITCMCCLSGWTFQGSLRLLNGISWPYSQHAHFKYYFKCRSAHLCHALNFSMAIWTKAILHAWEYFLFRFFSYQFSGVGLILNGMSLPNNSIVTTTDIGTGAAALVCTTTYTPCCSSANPETLWYFPNGSPVPNNPALSYHRKRGRDPGRVILVRNFESTTTGIFHCDIPDTSGFIQSLYVGIYDNSAGESCILTEWLVIDKRHLALQTRTAHYKCLCYTLNSISHVFSVPH